MTESTMTRPDRHALLKIAQALSISVDPRDRSLYRVHIEARMGHQRILTASMSMQDAENWRAHLIAAMVEACL